MGSRSSGCDFFDDNSLAVQMGSVVHAWLALPVLTGANKISISRELVWKCFIPVAQWLHHLVCNRGFLSSSPTRGELFSSWKKSIVSRITLQQPETCAVVHSSFVFRVWTFTNKISIYIVNLYIAVSITKHVFKMSHSHSSAVRPLGM